MVWATTDSNVISDSQLRAVISQATIGLKFHPRSAAEIATGITPTNYHYPPLNVKRYGATGDGVTDDYQAIADAVTVSDNAYFNGADYTVVFPPCAGNAGRYMVSQGFVIDRNGTRWRGEMAVRRVQPTAIAFTAAATDTTLMDVTGEAPAFDNLDFEGFSSADPAGKLFELHPKTRLPTTAEISARGLDSGTFYNFEDVDAEFNNCNFQFSTAAIHNYGRGLYVDACEFFSVTVGVDFDREAVFQRGGFSGQEEDTGLRGFAIRNSRFHGMGIDSTCVRNVGAQKANMGGLIFTGNIIDTFATVMYGPMKNAKFDCLHTGIRRKVFDAVSNGVLGNASGTYEYVSINGTYNCQTFLNQAAGVASTLDTAEITNATVIGVAATTGFTVGSFVLIELDDGSYHKSDIASISAGVSVTINTGIPSAAGIGNAIDMVTALNADNFVYCTGFKNLTIHADVADVFKDVIRCDAAPGDTLSVDGTFYDVMSDGDNAAYALVKLNGAAFTNINVAGAVQTGSFANNDALVQCVGGFSLDGYNFDGLAFDAAEWIPYSSAVSLSPFGAADATPSMMGRTHAETGTAALTITDIDDGVAGDIKTIISKGAITFDVTGTNLRGGTVDLLTANDDVTRWYCEDGTVWRLIGFMDNSVDNSGGA